jgi:glycosyltransferase involved in cell wall biosynthesis
MSIKLLQITAAYKPAYIYGGPTMSVAKLCESLAYSGVDIEVLTTTANGKEELLVPQNEKQTIDGVNVTYFERLTKDHTHFSPKLLWALRSKIKEAKKLNLLLVIHIHAWWNLVSILSCNLAKWYNIPIILSPRGMLTNYTLGNRNTGFKAIIHSILGKKLLEYCHIHATSEKEKQDIIQLIKPKSITIIHNLVRLPAENINLNIRSSEQHSFNLLYLSRIEEKKGLELLFEVLKELKINWKLTIAGSGDELYIMSLKELVQRLNMENRIEWIGQVDNSVKFDKLAENDLLILTSYNENFANVVIESLGVGTPVLISNQVGLANYVSENEFGWVAKLTVESITDQILNAFNHTTKRDKIRKEAPKIIRADFNSGSLVKKYITLYKQVRDVGL